MIIQNQKDLIKFCSDLSAHNFITIDTEFLREKTYYPKLCLIQISDPDGSARAVDPLMDNIDLTPVFELLQNKDVLKVFHAGRQDLEIFFNLTGKVVAPFFDTQIAAMVCGYGDSAGYESLVRQILDRQLDKSSQFTNWAHRPLTQKQIDYALGDVTHLIDIYHHLAKMLESKARTSWVMQEKEILADPATYNTDPYEAWQRIKIRSPKSKTLAILKELAAWREKKAQDKDIPKSWIMRDDVLANIAGQSPKTTKDLAKIRNMSKDIAEGATGALLLSLVKKATRSDASLWPQPQNKKRLPPNAIATVDMLKLLLKVQSSAHGVAAKLIASNKDLEIIASESSPQAKALQGWRHEIFGQYAIALKSGTLSIGLTNGDIALFKIDNKAGLHS